MIDPETQRVMERYARRPRGHDDRYSPLNPAVWNAMQERQRALLQVFRRFLRQPVEDTTLLEIGCGNGANLLELLRMGFLPENIIGNELLPARLQAARHLLPAAVRLLPGDAAILPVAPDSVDVVYQSTVFTSILDEEFRRKLAARMWSWAKPGGGVLWYDFTYDNPANPDVRGVQLAAVRSLFPEGQISAQRLTLAPPISRWVSRLHPALYSWVNVLPLLRTHVLCWIGKKS